MKSSVLKKSLAGINFFWLGISLAIFFAIVRVVGMLGGVRYQFLLPLSFSFMALLPYIFLTRNGRLSVGLKKTNSSKYYIYGIIMGAAASFACFALGSWLFGETDNNWFVTIKNFYYSNPAYSPNIPVSQLFLIFTLPAVIFSPIGEEVFFRGFWHLSMTERFSIPMSTIVDSLIFGMVHSVHHGIVAVSGTIRVYPVSGMIWVLLMFGTALIFGWLRNRSGSIYPAILSHAVFNFTMNFTVFYFLI